MTEQLAYDVVEKRGDVELRRYPAHLVAEVEVEGSFEDAGSDAFRPLAAYIGGRNQARRSIAMTAPVVQQQASRSQRIAMTAPVVQQEAEKPGRYVVGFVMPARWTEETLPVPADPQVRTRAVPTRLVAAVRWSGRWSRRTYEEKETTLLAGVAAAGWQVAGPVAFARYDPPWTPWFLRRNEALIPVDAASS